MYSGYINVMFSKQFFRYSQVPIKVYKSSSAECDKRGIMVEFKRALWRAFLDFKTLLLGAVISIIPIVNFALYGFALECARKPGRHLPGWRHFGSFWVRGLLAVIIMLLYLLPAGVLFYIALFVENDLPFFIGAVVLGIVGYYFLPMAWASFAHGGFSDAFGGKSFKLTFTGKYFAVWLALLVVLFLIALLLNVISLLLSFTIVGPFIIAGFSAYLLSVFAFTIYGELYQELI
jgi:MFS family permease